MSFIKLIKNKNVIKKINVPRFQNHSNLPPYSILENSPKLQYKSTSHKLSSSTASDTQQKKYSEVINVENSTVEKYLRFLFGLNSNKQNVVVPYSRGLHRNSEDGNQRKRSASQTMGKPLPRLLYIQNPLVWLTNKLDFRYLKNWDPHFSESEFTRGARQAVATITELLSKNMFDALKPLLTKTALLNLRKDVEILWAEEVRKNIALSPSDVQLIIPRKLHFRNISSDKKFCDIDMVFIALKWLETRGIHPNPPLVFIDIIVRFHRDYTEGMIPDWTISAFKVRRFNVVPQKN